MPFGGPHLESGRGVSLRSKCIIAAGVAALLVAGATLPAKDWPQWRGAERLGIWTETGIVRGFPDERLIVKWRAPINGGFVGPAVASGRLFVLDFVEAEPAYGTDRILVLDEKTGQGLWRHKWATSYRMLMQSYATGPRTTPTVDGDRVYLTGATGRISCFDAASGAMIWEHDTVAEYKARIPIWGTSIAPLIVGDYIYGIRSHGQVRGLRTDTGKRVWEAEGSTTPNRWASAHFVQHEDRYFVLSENGDLIIVRFAPDRYVELDRTHLLDPTSRTGYGRSQPGTRSRTRHGRSDRLVVWAHPAFANRHVVLRNDEEIIRVSLDEADY